MQEEKRQTNVSEDSSIEIKNDHNIMEKKEV